MSMRATNPIPINLEKAFGSAAKRHKRRKEIEQKPHCSAVNPFTQQVKH
jgi:hypothetical protein